MDSPAARHFKHLSIDIELTDLGIVAAAGSRVDGVEVTPTTDSVAWLVLRIIVMFVICNIVVHN